MVSCPVCDGHIDVDEEDVDEGDSLSCDECGADLKVVGTEPLELESADRADRKAKFGKTRATADLFDRTDKVAFIASGSGLGERVLAVFERADTIVLPVYPEIAALNAMHALLEYVTETCAGSSAPAFQSWMPACHASDALT